MPDTRIRRPRLAHQVRAALERGAVMVVAGPGYGKTTLLEEALDGHPGAVAWLACSERERDAGRLLAEIVAALGHAVPGAAGELLATLGGRVDVLALERRLLADLDRLLLEPAILVLDDAEALAGASDALAVVAALLRARPGALRTVVATRRPLGLATAKARAAGHLAQLGESDLSFGPEECAELLARLTGREPPESEVGERMAATLGWPLGIAWGIPGRDDGTLAAFVEEEMLTPLGPALRRAVLDAAVVDELVPELLGPLGLPGAFLQQAPALGLPLRPAPGGTGAHAFHPVLREILRARLQAERTPTELRELLARVAPALAGCGRPAEAVEAWLRAERWQEALETLTITQPLLLAAAPGTVRAVLHQVPAPVRRDPAARLLAARLALVDGETDTAVAELSAVSERFGELPPVPRWTARLVLAEALYWTGDMEAIAPLADGFDGPQAAGAERIAAAVAMWAGTGLAALGRREEAEAIAARVDGTRDPFAAMARAWQGWWLRTPAGEGDQALETIERVLARERAAGSTLPLELTFASIIFIHVDHGRLEEAIARAREFVRVSEGAAERPDLATIARGLLAWTLAVAGRAEESARLQGLAEEGGALRGLVGNVAAVTHALLARARGDDARALGLAERILAAPRIPALLHTLAALDVIPVVAAAGPAGAAREHADRALARLDAERPGPAGRHHRARLLSLRAWIAHGQGDLDGAAADAAAALAEAGRASPQVVRAERARLPVVAWDLIAAGTLAPEPLLAALAEGLPADLGRWARHPSPAARRAVALAVGRAGHGPAGVVLRTLAGDHAPEVAAAAQHALERLSLTPPAREFRLLGPFELRTGGWAVDDRAWGRPMAQRLVRYLLLHRDAPVLDETLIEAFWPDKDLRSARALLQAAASRARAVLDRPGSEASALRYSAGAYALALGPADRIDVEAFEAAAGAALAAGGPERRTLLERAAAAWTGDPLPEDRGHDWAEAARDRLRWRLGEVLGALVEDHLAAGDHVGAVDAAVRALACEPADERAHRGLMVAHARAGQRGRALRQYLECRRILVEALGIEPAVETAALQRRILAGEPV